MGKTKTLIIENTIFILFFLELSVILNLFIALNNNQIKIVQLIIFFIFLVLANIVQIFFKNTVREKGLVIGFEKILWKEINKIEKTNYSLKIIYKDNKEIYKEVMDFDSSYLDNKLKEKNISKK